MLALIESGSLGSFPAVNDCSAHPILFEKWGCESVAQIRVDGEKREYPCVPTVELNGVKIRLYRHPDLLVSDTVRLWKSDFKIKSKYGTRSEYDDFHPCYIYADELYDNYMKGLCDGTAN